MKVESTLKKKKCPQNAPRLMVIENPKCPQAEFRQKYPNFLQFKKALKGKKRFWFSPVFKNIHPTFKF